MSDLAATPSLSTWLEAHIPGLASPFALVKFPGGQSNPTYRIESSDRTAVLRRKPFGQLLPSAHAIEREYRLLAALHPLGLPVPKPFALCEDIEVAGAPFYVMELVDGRTLWDGSLPSAPPEERHAVYDAMIDTLGALHRIDPAAVGLGDYGPPGNHFARQVGRWSRQYRASQTEEIDAVEKLIEWLPRSVPEQTQTRIIHGDYRLDNLIYAPAEPVVSAILDWELSTLGDPLADVAYLILNWVLPHAPGKATIGGLDFDALGIPDRDAALDRYCRAAGRDDVPKLDWYLSYSIFRAVGILQGIKKRMEGGNASSTEAAKVVAQLPSLAAAGWDFARRAGAPNR